MDLFISTEQHYFKDQNGNYWVEGNEDYHFWTRYHAVFASLVIIARCKQVEKVHSSWKIASGGGVNYLELPEYKAFKGAAIAVPILFLRLWKNLKQDNGSRFLLRVPGFISLFTYWVIKVKKLPFGVEVVTDPEEAFQQATFGSRIVGLMRSFLVKTLKNQCGEAIATAYVTRETLQRKYPPGNRHTFNYSSIDIGEEVFGYHDQYKRRLQNQTEVLKVPKIVMVGRIHRPFKGVDIALKAISLLHEKGYNAKFSLIGGGVLMDNYQRLAEDLGIADSVRFLGELNSSDNIYKELLQSDTFVLPTRREGLPRAIIEAMAMGLPVLATPIGGIPELIDSEFIFPVDDVDRLSDLLLNLCNNPDLRSRVSKQNFKNSLNYRRKTLQENREQFYRVLQNGK